jgi:hypothetical protein
MPSEHAHSSGKFPPAASELGIGDSELLVASLLLADSTDLENP